MIDGGLCRPVSRILSTRLGRRLAWSGEIIIYLGPSSPTASSGLPAPPLRRATLSPPAPGFSTFLLAQGGGRQGAECSAVWPCTPWGLPSRPGHPRRWWSLTPPFHPSPVPRSLPASLSFLDSPAKAGGRQGSGPSAGLLSVALAVFAPDRVGDEAFPLGSTVPCGVRTFLPIPTRSGQGDDPASTI